MLGELKRRCAHELGLTPREHLTSCKITKGGGGLPWQVTDIAGGTVPGT